LRNAGGPVTGPGACADYLRYVLGMYPDLVWERTGPPMLSASGDRASFTWVGRGHFTGRMDPPGIDGTGQAFAFAGVEVFDFAGDRASALDVSYDLLGLLNQVGELGQHVDEPVDRVDPAKGDERPCHRRIEMPTGRDADARDQREQDECVGEPDNGEVGAELGRGAAGNVEHDGAGDDENEEHRSHQLCDVCSESSVVHSGNPPVGLVQCKDLAPWGRAGAVYTRVPKREHRIWLGAMKRVAAPLAAALLAAALTLFGAACGGSGAEPGASNEATPATLVLDFQPNAVHSGIYDALANGDYSDAGVHLTVREPSSSRPRPAYCAPGRMSGTPLPFRPICASRPR